MKMLEAKPFNENAKSLKRENRLLDTWLYPSPLPRPISIHLFRHVEAASRILPRVTSGDFFAQGPKSVFVTGYTWYECAAGKEKRSKKNGQKDVFLRKLHYRYHLSWPAVRLVRVWYKKEQTCTTLKKKKELSIFIFTASFIEVTPFLP